LGLYTHTHTSNHITQTHNGITLIALVITIIVILILSGVAISSLFGGNGILARAGEVRFKTEVSGYKEELQLYVLSQQMKSDEEFDTERFNRIPYRAGVSVDVNGTIKEIMPDMKNEYAKVFEIRTGKIVYTGFDGKQAQWCSDLDIEVTDIIVDENDVLVGIRDFVYINGVVTIPNYVRSISSGAFYNNKGIESVIFKEPSQVTVIPSEAFRNCSNLKSVQFPSGLTTIRERCV